jgi:putative chitinase
MKKIKKFRRLFLLCLISQVSLWAQYNRADEYTASVDFLSDLYLKTDSQKCDCEDYPDIIIGHDLLSALNAQILIRQMQEKQINEWKQRQNSVLKEEIEKQLGETFSSFAQAQSMFFRKLESENVTRSTSTSRRKYERYHSQKIKKHWKDLQNIKLLNFREREIHAGAIDNSQYGHLTYESTPLSEITTLEQLEIFKNQELASFGDNEWRMYEDSEMRKELEEIEWLTYDDDYSYKNENEMYDALVEEQKDYYRSLDTWTQLDVMQWYLNHVKGPVTSSSGYYPKDFGTSDYIEDYARGKKEDIPFEIRIFDPIYASQIIRNAFKVYAFLGILKQESIEAAKAAHIAKSLEAVSEEAMLLEACFASIGAENRKAVEANAGLQEAVTNYFSQNRYNKTSVDRIRYLMTQHRTDQYFVTDLVYYTSHKCSHLPIKTPKKKPICRYGRAYPRFQDFENQILALEVLLNVDAREAGFRYFVEVLAALYAEDSYAGKKGYILRDIFEANGISVPIGLSNETLEYYFTIGTGSDGSLTLAIFFKPGLGELLFSHGISLQEFLNEYWESMEETTKNDCGQGKVRDSNGNCVACLEKDLLGNCAKKITWVKDADNDNYYAAGSEREEYPTWKAASHFKKKSETLGEDCDDSNARKTTDCSDDCNTSKEDLKKIFPNASDSRLESISDAINKYGQNFGLDTKEKLHHFLAQAAVESHGLKSFGEYTNYQTKSAMRIFGSKFNDIGKDNSDSNKKNLSDFGIRKVIRNGKELTYIKNSEDFFNFIYADANRSAKTKLGNTQSGDGWKYRGRGIIQITGRENYTKFNDWYKNNTDAAQNLLNSPDLLKNNVEIGVISGLWFFKNNVMSKIDVDENTSVYSLTYYINSKREHLKERKENFKKAKDSIDCK